LLPRRGGDRFYHRAPTRQTKARKSRQRAEYLFGSSAEKKPKAYASEPKPPRVTWPDPESELVPNADLPDEESPPKKLLREDDPPPPPWLPEDDPRGGHSALPCNSDGDDG
jgi:hypothetical protein